MDDDKAKKIQQLSAENQKLRAELEHLKTLLSVKPDVKSEAKNLTSEESYPAALSFLLFETLFEKDPDGVILLNSSGEVIKSNSAWCEQLGLPAEEVIGKHISYFLTETEKFKPAYKELIENGSLEITLEQKCFSGKPRMTVRKAVKVEDTESSDFWILAISRDISEQMAKEENEREIRKKLHTLNHELYTLNQLHESTLVELEESYEALEAAYSKLKESENNYRIISENTGDYIFRISISEKKPSFSYVGPAVRKLGYNPQELFGKNPIDYIYQEDREKTFKLVSKYYYEYKASGKLSFEEDIYLPVRVPVKSGKLLHLECTVNISQTEIIIIAKDITDLVHEMELNKRRKTQLQKIEKSYRNLYNSASDVFLIIDADLRILDANKAATEVFGYTKQELRRLEIKNILSFKNLEHHPDNPPFLFLQKTHEDYGLYIEAYNKSGDSIWMSVVFEKTAFNEQPATFAVLRNTTELKKAQDSLRESEQKFRMLAESGGSGILIYSENKFVYANKTIEEITGYTFAELRKMYFWEVIHPDMRDFVKDRGMRRLAGEKVESNYEMKVLTKQGKEKWVSFSGKAIEYKGLPAAIGNVVDITDYKNTIEKWKAAKEKAEESDRLKSAFLSNMSHEIRTPMNGIIGFSQLLEDDSLDTDSRIHYIDIIKSSSKQLLRIIDDILDVSKIEVGQMTVKKEWHVADIILIELFDVFEKRIADSGLDIELRYTGSQSGEKLYTDSVRLKQILTNLIDNALKYTEKGSISFGYHKRDDELLFFVKDTGCGIETDLHKYIFTRFGRLEKNYLKSVRGTGLGLAICKGLVELLGGEIYFESDGKTGTDFYFTHPIYLS